MKVSLRVLTALSDMASPDEADVEALRQYLGNQGPSDPGELCCEVIKKSLWARDRIRMAIRGEALMPIS